MPWNFFDPDAEHRPGISFYFFPFPSGSECSKLWVLRDYFTVIIKSSSRILLLDGPVY